MKKVTMIIWLAYLPIAGCTSKKLSPEEAFRLIQQDQQYPKVIDYDLYCSDPQHARTAVDAGLEKEGVITVQQTQKLSDVGKPLIAFTSKAQPYLLATPQEDKELNVQKVKLADEELIEVTSIKAEKGDKSAVVEYTTAYKNVTPFAALHQTRFTGKNTHKAYFSLINDEWRLDKKK